MLTGGIRFVTVNSPFTLVCRTKCCIVNQLQRNWIRLAWFRGTWKGQSASKTGWWNQDS